MFIQYLRWCAYLTLWLARDLADQTTNQKQIQRLPGPSAPFTMRTSREQPGRKKPSILWSAIWTPVALIATGLAPTAPRWVAAHLGILQGRRNRNKNFGSWWCPNAQNSSNFKVVAGYLQTEDEFPNNFPYRFPNIFFRLALFNGAAQKRQPRQHHLVLSHVLREGALGEHRLCTSAKLNEINGWN